MNVGFFIFITHSLTFQIKRASILVGMAPLLGFGQAEFWPDPTQLWNLPSGGWVCSKMHLALCPELLCVCQACLGQFWPTLARCPGGVHLPYQNIFHVSQVYLSPPHVKYSARSIFSVLDDILLFVPGCVSFPQSLIKWK